ncbi:RNA methyltransferase [Aggregatimonas sangjinii]|uniref:RNA methyltransferase n=1 Tax=Aggregatimonas sangjinii TaxID=2583587 RepID=A0A5B7SRF4_9FLAO|nr:RNA methyltransferase [Aggregatimonas sangjinii]QCX01147.1 RNA methyltransferase [Aggregatimonas sangjinii]
MRKLKNEELPRLDIKAFKQAPKTPLVIILDDIRSLNNIGSIFRTSDAFLVEKIYLCGITATPPHKDIRKTALGATESVAWEHVEDCVALVGDLEQQGFTTIAIEQAENATMLQDYEVSKNQKYALIFGNEVKGVAQEVVDRCDDVIEIPQYGTKHSLNISVSVGVVVWNFWSKLQN